MHQARFVKLALVTGSAMTAIGVFSEFSGISELPTSLLAMNLVAIGSLLLTLLGLVVVIVSSVFWARSAPVARVAAAGLVAGAIAAAIYLFGNVNVHGASFILVPVMMAGAVECALSLWLAGIRGTAAVDKR